MLANQVELVNLLLNGLDINTTNKSGETALLKAARRKQIPLSRELINQGADLNVRDKNGLSVLELPFTNSGRTIEYLMFILGYDVNYERIDETGGTVLHRIVSQSMVIPEAVIPLILRGVDPHKKNNSGLTFYEIGSGKPSNYDPFRFVVYSWDKSFIETSKLKFRSLDPEQKKEQMQRFTEFSHNFYRMEDIVEKGIDATSFKMDNNYPVLGAARRADLLNSWHCTAWDLT
ncbi:Ankyrin [Chitinispirillum alkaliphilum]|nr:Ankyrin [Chitinispirillum alkaliphilum]